MTCAQLEYIDTYHEPLPLDEMRERMKRLLLDLECLSERIEKKEAALRAAERLWSGVHPATVARLKNEATQLALEARRVDDQIVDVARQIVAEADNAELIGERNTE